MNQSIQFRQFLLTFFANIIDEEERVMLSFQKRNSIKKLLHEIANQISQLIHLSLKDGPEELKDKALTCLKSWNEFGILLNLNNLHYSSLDLPTTNSNSNNSLHYEFRGSSTSQLDFDSFNSRASIETPPLRTPPPSPGHSRNPSPRSSVTFTPPLRTPPPSPGTSRKNTSNLTNDPLTSTQFTISSSHGFPSIIAEEIDRSTTITPPLRTPPPSPPASPHSSRRSSVDVESEKRNSMEVSRINQHHTTIKPPPTKSRKRNSSSPHSFLELTLNNPKKVSSSSSSSGINFQTLQWKKGQLLGKGIFSRKKRKMKFI